MLNINFITLGSNLHFVDLNKIRRHRSRLFQIKSISSISSLPNPDHFSLYLDQQYQDSQLIEILGPDSDEIRICIINCRLQDNFYVRRLSRNTAVISLWTPKTILDESQISIENFIIKNIYEMATMYVESNGNLTSEEVYRIPHIDTRGCLFDMNGDLHNIIHNTEQPNICSGCKARLSTKKLPKDFLKNLEYELKKIKKSGVLRIEITIKRYPFLSLSLTILLGIFINVISTFFMNIVLNMK